MSQEIPVVFTAKSVETLLAEGGTSAWRLDRNHARQCAYVVCTRNAKAEWVEGPEPHQSAFLVGKISDVVPAPDRPERYLIQFREYARVDIPNVWKGDRNPIRYSTLQELGIDPVKLKWQPIPNGSARARDQGFPHRGRRTRAESPPARDVGQLLVSYVTKVGDNFALLVSQPILEHAGLSEGSRVEIEPVDDGRIMISRSKRHFTLAELLAGMTPDREHPLEDDAPRGEETL